MLPARTRSVHGALLQDKWPTPRHSLIRYETGPKLMYPEDPLLVIFGAVEWYFPERWFKYVERLASERWLQDDEFASDNRDVFEPFHLGPHDSGQPTEPQCIALQPISTVDLVTRLM